MTSRWSTSGLEDFLLGSALGSFSARHVPSPPRAPTHLRRRSPRGRAHPAGGPLARPTPSPDSAVGGGRGEETGHAGRHPPSPWRELVITSLRVPHSSAGATELLHHPRSLTLLELDTKHPRITNCIHYFCRTLLRRRAGGRNRGEGLPGGPPPKLASLCRQQWSALEERDLGIPKDLAGCAPRGTGLPWGLGSVGRGPRGVEEGGKRAASGRIGLQVGLRVG